MAGRDSPSSSERRRIPWEKTRPVQITTPTPRASASRTAARVRGATCPAGSSSVPSTSSAISRYGDGDGDAAGAAGEVRSGWGVMPGRSIDSAVDTTPPADYGDRP